MRTKRIIKRITSMCLLMVMLFTVNVFAEQNVSEEVNVSAQFNASPQASLPLVYQYFLDRKKVGTDKDSPVYYELP